MKKEMYVQEIIEFSAVVLNMKTGRVANPFQMFVKPTVNPVLSEFCKGFTGIKQEQVDNGSSLSHTLDMFDSWLKERRLRRNAGDETIGFEWVLATWSDWDLTTCLAQQCRWMKIDLPEYYKKWIDIKKSYRTLYGRTPRGVKGSMEDLGLAWEGQEHSGIDDAKNTARLAHRMLQNGWTPTLSERCLPKAPATPAQQSEKSRIQNLTAEAGITLRPSERATAHIDGELVKKGKSVTAPLCGCGKRAGRKVVRTSGKNLGRVYFGCGKCGFFQWF
ncbi:hypothetical protein HDV00_008508 [Rhizophlyctis rosea]|nr:hypothetical protein HDV00_008508 [Rhizophlyctis rosea]